MFCVRRALHCGARLACAQFSIYRHCTPTTCKSKVTVTICPGRFTHEDVSDRKVLGQLDKKMKLIFTCKKCKTRNNKLISKLAYTKGVIIVRCDGCRNNHLIADNLGWFTDIGKHVNIEKLMALKGENVRKIMDDIDGYFEVVTKEELKFLHDNEKSMVEKSSDDEQSVESADKTAASKES